jgi:hypothetical protein
MSALLLGLPLESALQELAERGVTQVTVNRLLAPKAMRDVQCAMRNEWRVVRVREGDTVTLDVCRFTERTLVGAALGRPPGVENDRIGGD